MSEMKTKRTAKRKNIVKKWLGIAYIKCEQDEKQQQQNNIKIEHF